MALLEREREMERLEALWQESASGGRLAIVIGEAGVGKSALIDAFLRGHRGDTNILAGASDPLVTPVPFGALRDMASAPGSSLAPLLDSETPRDRLFAGFLTTLQRHRTIAAFEDAHWADEATLDIIRFVGRRIQQTQSLLVVTIRDLDPAAAEAQQILGELPAAVRLRVPPLSRTAVDLLAATNGRRGDDLFQLTGGNAFYVTEVLASGDVLPLNVRDAVLARASKLTASAREALEIVSIAPGRMERKLLQEIDDVADSAIDEAVNRGMLRLDGEMLSFRHEIARLTIEESLPPLRRRHLHARALELLSNNHTTSLARLVHHAAGAHDGARVLELAPAAARQAAAAGAHREAAAHYRRAIEFADALRTDERAELLELLAYECYLTEEISAALDARIEASKLWESEARRDKVGASHRWRSRLHWFLGQRAEAEEHAENAIAILETLPPGRELAMAWSNRAQLAMLSDDVDEARAWGMRAIALARELGDDEITAHALNNVGSAEALSRIDPEAEKLRESLAISLQHGFGEHVARAYTNLASSLARTQRFTEAAAVLDEGIGYAAEHDLDSWIDYMMGWKAHVELTLGGWEAAIESAKKVLASPRVAPVSRTMPLLVLAVVGMRRGEAGVEELLAEAAELAVRSRELQRLVPVTVARAEAAWLGGDWPAAFHVTGDLLQRLQTSNVWSIAELLLWHARVGGAIEPVEQLPEMFRKELQHDLKGAAAAWEAVGATYNAALVLARGDAEDRQAAIDRLERLGAHATVAAVNRRGDSSAEGKPARRSKRKEHPAGLTQREVEVLLLVAEGCRNADIADRLFVSPKTVDHHVSSILAKLGAKSRSEAAARARSIGIFDTAK